MWRVTCALTVGVMLGIGAIPGFADSPRNTIVLGHDHFQAGRYEEALAAFEQVPEAGNEPVLPELLHDKAAAQFKLGRLDDARETWVRAGGLRDAAFEAQCKYNIGNCHYEQALQQIRSEQPQPAAALKLLGEAISQYRDSLRLDPQLANARANLELAARLKKQIEEQKPPDSQPQSQPNSQPNQEQNDKNQDDQQQQQPQSQPSDNQQNQDEQDQQDQQNQQNQDSPSNQQQNQNQQPQQDPNNPQPQDPNSKQPKQEQQAGEQEQPPREVNMSPEEAQRLLQKVRDAEKARREALRARQRTRPVEKDW